MSLSVLVWGRRFLESELATLAVSSHRISNIDVKSQSYQVVSRISVLVWADISNLGSQLQCPYIFKLKSIIFDVQGPYYCLLLAGFDFLSCSFSLLYVILRGTMCNTLHRGVFHNAVLGSLRNVALSFF